MRWMRTQTWFAIWFANVWVSVYSSDSGWRQYELEHERAVLYMWERAPLYRDDRLNAAVSVTRVKEFQILPIFPDRGKSYSQPSHLRPSFNPFLTASLIRSAGFSRASKHATNKGESLIQIALSLAFLSLSLPLCLSFVAYRGLWLAWQTAKASQRFDYKGKGHEHADTKKQTYLYSEEHSKEAVFIMGLPSEGDVPVPLRGTNWITSHWFHIQGTLSKTVLNERISKDVLWKCRLSEPQDAWVWQSSWIRVWDWEQCRGIVSILCSWLMGAAANTVRPLAL